MDEIVEVVCEGKIFHVKVSEYNNIVRQQQTCMVDSDSDLAYSEGDYKRDSIDEVDRVKEKWSGDIEIDKRLDSAGIERGMEFFNTLASCVTCSGNGGLGIVVSNTIERQTSGKIMYCGKELQ
ncbi:hypothetical protein V6N13_082335 [Hibiscus sabdariffa]|uniref:Uncharacterized protein n=1 Tax=Hibiscus sabdariffa TaxID=183260 RepID=A0ABR2Q339_9ROSI